MALILEPATWHETSTADREGHLKIGAAREAEESRKQACLIVVCWPCNEVSYILSGPVFIQMQATIINNKCSLFPISNLNGA
jgi:hypothetical protein